MHEPVLLQEVIDFLDPSPGDFIIDGTVDGGGHAKTVIEKIMPGGKFLGIDLDEKILSECKSRLLTAFKNDKKNNKNIFLQLGNYADVKSIIKENKFEKADGLLLDLGFSSEQLECSGRGFSFSDKSVNEPLLMTYDDSSKSLREILKNITEKQIADIIYEFGGERFSRKIAKAIFERERKKPIMFTGEFSDVIRQALPNNYEHGRIDKATRTFQAFRIYINKELENIKNILSDLEEIIKPNGRVVIISFHSLEDKIIKQKFQELAKEKKVDVLTKKPIVASSSEIKQNIRSRSAKLRAIKFKEI
jgi:16S rRNA (cytosine1402-N4)-methyltransferase